MLGVRPKPGEVVAAIKAGDAAVQVERIHADMAGQSAVPGRTSRTCFSHGSPSFEVAYEARAFVRGESNTPALLFPGPAHSARRLVDGAAAAGTHCTPSISKAEPSVLSLPIDGQKTRDLMLPAFVSIVKSRTGFVAVSW
jgi:hypothetical protein